MYEYSQTANNTLLQARYINQKFRYGNVADNSAFRGHGQYRCLCKSETILQ